MHWYMLVGSKGACWLVLSGKPGSHRTVVTYYCVTHNLLYQCSSPPSPFPPFHLFTRLCGYPPPNQHYCLNHQFISNEEFRLMCCIKDCRQASRLISSFPASPSPPPFPHYFFPLFIFLTFYKALCVTS